MNILQKIDCCLNEMTHFVDKPDEWMKHVAKTIGYTDKRFKIFSGSTRIRYGKFPEDFPRTVCELIAEMEEK